MIERGFFHPKVGYWQTIGDKFDINDNPSGTIQVPIKPTENHIWQDGKWVYVEPEGITDTTPDEISRRQFFQRLEKMSIISKVEALAAMTNGAIPTPLRDILDTIEDEDDKFDATMLVVGAMDFNRNNPFAEVVRAAMQWTVEQKDDFWREAHKL